MPLCAISYLALRYIRFANSICSPTFTPLSTKSRRRIVFASAFIFPIYAALDIDANARRAMRHSLYADLRYAKGTRRRVLLSTKKNCFSETPTCVISLRARRVVQKRALSEAARRRVLLVRNRTATRWLAKHMRRYTRSIIITLLRSAHTNPRRNREAYQTYTALPRRTQTTRGR